LVRERRVIFSDGRKPVKRAGLNTFTLKQLMWPDRSAPKWINASMVLPACSRGALAIGTRESGSEGAAWFLPGRPYGVMLPGSGPMQAWLERGEA
jgi:hypothetical protein